MHYHLILKALSVVALGTIGINLSFADTITLKSGKVLEGKVLEERADEYLLEVQITRSIKDRKTVKKSDVVSIEKTAEDAQPFKELQGILPTGDQMQPGEYKLLIEGKLKPFLANFPDSQHLPEVKKMLATLESELKRVEAGEIKLKGAWIAAAEWNSNAFDLDSLVLFNKLEEFAKAGYYRQTLLTYDELKNGYPTSEGLTKSRDIVQKILPAYQKIIATQAGKAKQSLEDRLKAIENLPIRDRTRVKETFDAERARYQQLLDKAREEKIRWIPVYAYDGRSLGNLERTIKSEIASLNRLRPDRENLAELYRQAWKAAGQGDETSVRRLLSKFRSKKIDPKYGEIISAHLAANPAPEPVEEKVEPKPTPQPEPVVEEKPKPKKKPQRDIDEDLTEPEKESSGMMGIVYAILGIAIIGILLGVFLKSRKSEDGE